MTKFFVYYQCYSQNIRISTLNNDNDNSNNNNNNNNNNLLYF